MGSGNLFHRRHDLETQWHRFIAGDDVNDCAIRDEIGLSWQRSAQYLNAHEGSAPVEDTQTIDNRWKKSPLSQAAAKDQSNIKQLAKEGELVAAISDPQGTLLWTYASKHMQSRAESVNFRQGGRWDESSAGTNAVGLSITLKKPVTVFSSEHYQPFVHDWVCYAAPIVHPESGLCVGILDLSTTWKHHTPLGQAAVNDMARSIALALPKEQPKAALEIHAMGNPRVLLHGKSLKLTKRQLEILIILALNPQGLHLDAFHAALYGDESIASTTLKAELSNLRRLLGGNIGSRPYRLKLPVWADFIEIWQVLKTQKLHDAIALYRAPLLAQSTSPSIEEWRNCIDAVMQRAVHSCTDSELLIQQVCQSNGHAVIRERLEDLARNPSEFW